MKISAFIGKGGVGKSTLAVCLTQILRQRGKAICVGIDQQHNHRDIIKALDLPIDFKAVTNKVSDMVNETIENCFMKGFTEYTSLIMPTFIAVSELAELVHEIDSDYENVVIDMPPNTSALTMLRMPDILNNIAFKGLTLKNRVKRMVKGSDTALDNMEYMTEISNQFKVYMDKGDYYVVGITTELGFLETKRAVDKLNELNYGCKAIIVNMVEPIPDADSNLLHQRYTFANMMLSKYNNYGRDMNIPIIQIPFTFDHDEVLEELTIGLDEHDL